MLKAETGIDISLEILVRSDSDTVSQRWMEATDPDSSPIVGDMGELLQDQATDVRTNAPFTPMFRGSDGSRPILVSGSECGGFSRNNAWRKFNKNIVETKETGSGITFELTAQLAEAVDPLFVLTENSVLVEGKTQQSGPLDQMQERMAPFACVSDCILSLVTGWQSRERSYMNWYKPENRHKGQPRSLWKDTMQQLVQPL